MKERIYISIILKLLFALIFQIVIYSCAEKAEDNIDINDSNLRCTVVPPEGFSEDLLHRCKIIGINDNMELKSTSCGINAIKDSLVHTYIVADNDNRVYMMTRVNPLNSNIIEIDTESTALSLVTLHPLFGPFIGDDYETIIRILKSSSKYASFCDCVEEVIKQNKSLFDETNSELITSLEALYDDVLSDLDLLSYDNAVPVASRKFLTRAEFSSPKINPTYIYADLTNNTFTLQCRGLTPSYFGYVTTPIDGDTIDFAVTSRPDYGGMDIFKSYNEFNLGPKTQFVFHAEGEYRFHLTRINQEASIDFCLRLTKSILNIIGINLGNDTAIKEIATLVANALISVGSNLIAMDETTFKDWFGIAYQVTLDYLQRNTSYIAQNNLLAGLRNYALILGNSWNFYNRIKGVANSTARICYSFAAPPEIDFCLCCYNGDISTCKEAWLIELSGNNQKGKPNEALKEPLKVDIVTIGDDYLWYSPSSYHQLKFEVVSGGGTVNPVFPKADSENCAETYWTLGSEGQQEVIAVMCDVITDKEICIPVHFYATLLDKDADEYCPDGNHPHVIDLGLPSGTKWACCNVGANYPYEYGAYFSWGETKSKEIYDIFSYSFWKNLPYAERDDADFWCSGNKPEDGIFYVKYTAPDYIIGTEYDAAKVCWGGDWIMPSKEDYEELYKYAFIFPTKHHDVVGYYIDVENVKLFFPNSSIKESVYDRNTGCYTTFDDVGPEPRMWHGSEPGGFAEIRSNFYALEHPYMGGCIRAVVKPKR